MLHRMLMLLTESQAVREIRRVSSHVYQLAVLQMSSDLADFQRLVGIHKLVVLQMSSRLVNFQSRIAKGEARYDSVSSP
jgi:hypothetical protein